MVTPSKPHYERGFNLIELMVVVVILGIVIGIGTSLSSGWYNSANQQQAKSLLEQGTSRARSLALRNPDAATGTQPAAGLCLSGQTLSVLRQTPSSGLSCTASTSTLLWSATLPESIIVKDSDSNSSQSNLFYCLGLDNRGVLLGDKINDQACSIDSSRKAVSLYVCPCFPEQKSQHTTLCPINNGCLEVNLY